MSATTLLYWLLTGLWQTGLWPMGLWPRPTSSTRLERRIQELEEQIQMIQLRDEPWLEPEPDPMEGEGENNSLP